MLFQRIYNWIKYKTLPVSYLFKNRLFVERDTKNKRIYNMLGLVFRNTKWANAEFFNIKYQFQSKFFKFIFLLLFFAFILLFLINKFYFNKVYLIGEAIFLIWLSYDAFDYYLTYFIWIILLLNYFFTLAIFNLFTYRVFTTERFNLQKLNTLFFNSFNDNYKNKNFVTTLEKKDLKFLLLHWLSSDSISDKTELLNSLFDSEQNKLLWQLNYQFFPKLYISSYYCNLLISKSSLNELRLCWKTSNFFNNKIKPALNNFYRFNSYFTKLFWYFLKNENLYFDVNRINSNPSVYKNIWYLDSIRTEKSNTALIYKFANSSFYLNSWSMNNFNFYKNLINEFQNLPVALLTQTQSAKNSRWLYKYSILHRRIIKNAHKLTVSKNLFTSGVYSFDMIKKNTWASHRWEYLNSKLLSNLNQIFYGNLFPQNNYFLIDYKLFETLYTQTSRDKFFKFSFVENSFFWSNKRFYFLNTLSSNQFLTQPISNLLSESKMILDTTNLNLHFLFLYKLLSLYSFNTGEFSILSTFLNFTLKNDNYLNNELLYNDFDVYLEFEDFDFFSNDVLDISYWVSSNNVYIKNYFFFQNYFLIKNLHSGFDLNLYEDTIIKSFNFNKIIFTEETIIKDLYFINFLLK